MAERVIGLVSCVMCAIPFWIMAKYDVNSKTPINFWSGDTTLTGIVKDVPEYNREMAKLYGSYGLMYFICGIGCLLFPPLGYGLLCLTVVGIAFVYRSYKKILKKYAELSDKKVLPGHRRSIILFWSVLTGVFLLLWIPLLTAEQNSGWFIVSILGTMAEVIVGMAVYYTVMERENKKKR